MNYLENITVVWQRLSLVQRAILIAILIAGGIIATFLTKWASSPDMTSLYTGLSAEDAGKICDKLGEKSVPFELRGTGSIYVPKEYVYQMRADLAKDGLPGGDSPGYKLFEEGNFGMSPFLQDVNYTRALQDEIAKSIELFDTVTGARVHIVRPEQNVFKNEEGNATASVVLQVRPGFKVSQGTIAAIAYMVAGSVEGLRAEGVTVVDSQGNLLSSVAQSGVANSANTFMDYKQKTENKITEDIQRMLQMALGPGRSSIVVSAAVDMDSEETLTTTYSKGEPIKEVINTVTEKTGGGVDLEGNTIPPSDEKSEEEITTEKLVPETTKKTSKMAGRILSVSVAAVVDLTAPAVPAEESKEDEQATAKTSAAAKKILSVEQVENLIFSAVGREILKKENLSVVDTPFNRPVVPPEAVVPWHKKYIGIVKQGSLGIMAVCALLVLKMFGGKARAGRSTASANSLGSGEGSPAMLPAGDTREQILKAYRSDPEQVKELFTNWLEEKG